MSCEELNQAFGRSGAVAFEQGPNNVSPVAVISNKSGSVRVLLHGSHVLSWKNAAGVEKIYLSKTAFFQKDKAVRGGIPVCWPQFGPNGPLVQHGFARTSLWSVEASHVDTATDSVSVTLVLYHSDATRSLWNNNEFKLTLKTELSGDGALLQTLTAQNLNQTGDFLFTTALHTYFVVSDVTKTTVSPLKGVEYVDKVAAGQLKIQDDDDVSFSGEVDRVYCNPPTHTSINVQQQKNVYTIDRTNFPDLVLWNIGEIKQKTMADLSSWSDYVCAEVGAIQHPVVLSPGQTWSATQIIKSNL